MTYCDHTTRHDNLSLREAVAWLAGEEHSDLPACACPVLAAYGGRLHDAMGGGRRGAALRARYLGDLPSRLVHTRSAHDTEMRRAYILADCAVRVFAPLALDGWGYPEKAATLRALPPVRDQQSAVAAAIAAKAARVSGVAAYAATAAANAAAAATAAANAANAAAAGNAAANAAQAAASSADATADVWSAARDAFDAALEAR